MAEQQALHESDTTRLWNEVGDLKVTVGQLTIQVHGMTSQFELLSHKLEQVFDRMGSTGRTSWGPLAAWATVILLLVGMAGAPYTRQITELRDKAARKQAEEIPRAESRGRMLQRIEDDKDRLVDQELRLRQLEQTQHREALHNQGVPK